MASWSADALDETMAADHPSAVLSQELRAVMSEAMHASSLEDAQQYGDAVQSYHRALSRLAYVLDALVGPEQQPLVDVIRGLQEAYDMRIQRLRSRLPPGPAQAACCSWLEVYGQQPGSASSSATAGAVHGFGDAAAELMPAQQLACYAGGGLEAVEAANPMGWGPEDKALNMAVLQQCRREVSGGLEDVLGMEDIKDEVEEAVFLPLKHPKLFQGVRQPPRTFLLYGPPGTGKTLLVEKIAAEAELALLAVSPSAVLSKWSGESERSLRAVFELARALQPSAIFLDELDSLGQSRGGASDDSASRRILTELLIQLSKLQQLPSSELVLVFAATNRLQDCDTALLRRFERRMPVPLPDHAARRSFLSTTLQQPELCSDISAEDLESLCQASEGYSGSDLAAVCRDAAMAPVRELFKGAAGKRRRCTPGAVDLGGALAGVEAQTGSPPLRKLCAADVHAALTRVRPPSADAAAAEAAAVTAPMS